MSQQKKSDGQFPAGKSALFLIFVGIILYLLVLVYGDGVFALLVLSFAIVLVGLGMGVYHIAHKIERDSRRRVFFAVCYGVSLAVSIASVFLIAYSTTVMCVEGVGWRGQGYWVVGWVCAFVGLGLIGSVTGGLVAHKINKKKHDKQNLTDTPEN